MRRTVVACALGAAAAIATMIATASPAAAATTPEAGLAALITNERAAHGLPPLKIDGSLAAEAESHSARMGSAGSLFHSDLDAHMQRWSAFGENVGAAASIDAVHDLFMSSAAHRGNILSSRFTTLGIGAVRRGGRLYVTEMFAAGALVERHAGSGSSRDTSAGDANAAGDGGPGPGPSSAGTGAARTSSGAHIDPAPRPRSNTVEMLARLMGESTWAAVRERGGEPRGIRSDARRPWQGVSSLAPAQYWVAPEQDPNVARAGAALLSLVVTVAIGEASSRRGAAAMGAWMRTPVRQPASRTRGPPPDT